MSLYTAPHFTDNRPDILWEFIQTHPFASLISAKNNHLAHISKVPVLLEHDGDLIFGHAHLAKANPHWRYLLEHPQLTLMFDGPHGYISPLSYQDPRNNVPTWNYSSVLVQGTAQIVEDQTYLKQSLQNLVARYERDNTWQDQVNPTLIEHLSSAIVGIRIQIQNMQGAFKLSQNKPPSTLKKIMSQQETLHPQLAQIMKKINAV